MLKCRTIESYKYYIGRYIIDYLHSLNIILAKIIVCSAIMGYPIMFSMHYLSDEFFKNINIQYLKVASYFNCTFFILNS